MLVLQPVSMEKIWGTKRLHNYCGDPEIDRIGIVYTASGIPTITNPIDDDQFGEKDFQSAVKNNPQKFGLTEEYEEFPIIVAFTAADADLSIQVHPTDDYARAHENAAYGKSESWYFIDAPKEGWIYTGSKEQDKDLIDRKMKAGAFEEVIGKLEVEEEDLVFIPAGTLHALTKGSLVYEIQQSTDITYRFYDFEREDSDGQLRELHTEKAIETLKTEQDSELGRIGYEIEVDEAPYTLKLSELKEDYHNDQRIAQIVTIIEGEYVLNGHLLIPGQSVVVFPEEEIKVEVKEIGKVMIATPHI